MFSSTNSKSKLIDLGNSNFRGGYNNNNNAGDYYDTPLSFTSPGMRGLGRDASNDLYEPFQGQGSIKYGGGSPNPYMRNQGSKSISSQLTPLKANADNFMNARDKFNRSQIEDIHAIVGDNSQFLGKHKPRAMSQLKTSQYGTNPQRIELNSVLTKKNTLAPLGIKTPMPNKDSLSDFAWQSMSNGQLPQIGKAARSNLVQSFKLPPSGPSGAFFLQKKQGTTQDSAINQALKKIARAGEDFSNMRDYARALITRFDKDFDGVITFQELCDGLDSFDIDISIKDRMALMKKLDVDADGDITEVELSNALQTVDSEIVNEAVNTALKKISAGSEGYSSIRDYVKDLVRKFDHNSDGLLSIHELSEGLSKIHIYLNQREVQALMDKIDQDRDGEITAEELLTAINSAGTGFSSGQLQNSIDWVVRKLISDGTSFPSMKDYARHLIRKFDKDSDGIISFQELCEGLAKLSIFISTQEKHALMERLDIDRDGKITENEMLKVLTDGGASTDNAVDSTIRKIAAGASKYGSMSEYVKDLVRKFDRNSDGFLSIGELTDGLKKIGIFLNSQEIQALMRKLDLNRDGEVSADEILAALGGSTGSSSIDKIISKLSDGAKSFASLRDYCKHLIRKFDRDNDGIITFTELCDGLSKLNLTVSQSDKKALMERLDIDRDGKITEAELYRVFSGEASHEYIDQTIRKIATGATKYSSMSEYVRDLVRKFDRNSDGFLSIQELTEGLTKIGIFLTQKEIQALMNKLDLNRDGEVSADEILSVLSSTGHGGSNSSIDKLVERLASGSKSFPSMKEYAKNLIRKFDRDNDGIITFTELCDGLTKMGINVSQQDKQGLMERLDIDRDGRITEHEILRVLSGTVSQEIIEQTIRKIASGAKGFSSMAEYVRDLIRKFDRNSDGLLSIGELTDGLTKIGIFLTQKEVQALMGKMDLNRDGEVSAEEILKVLTGVGNTGFAMSSGSSSVDNVINKLVINGKSFGSMKDYARHLIKKFDRDNDGIITFSELCDGLLKLNIMISQADKKALMERLDIDRDGKISETEIFRVLSGGAAPEIIEQTLRKIAAGASGYGSLGDYTRDLVRKFDRNGDGLISINELADGLGSMSIFLTQKEQQALMNKIDLDRDGEISAQEILQALQAYHSTSATGVDSILKRLVSDSKSFGSLREYSAHLIRKFDRDNDGIITFSELCDGLGKLSLSVSQADKKGLMDRLDLDRDGKITESEIYKALSSVSEKGTGYGSTLSAENTLRKIAGGAKNFTSMADYVKDLIRKFDRNNDGLLTMQELTTGLTKIGITLNNNEVQALMNRLDLNRDGEVSGEELLNVLKRYDTRQISNPAIDKIVKKLVEGGSRFPSMRDYARHLIKTFDRDSDGIITFNELCDGLLKMKIIVTQNEKQGLMDRLDIDRDGKITETEMFRVLLSADTSAGDHATNFAADQTIKKIADGATKFGGSLSQYVKDLVRKFDRNSDGLLSIQELTDGLKKMGINLNQKDTETLMKKFDLNRDGEVSADEILKVLQGGSAQGPSIDHIILKLAAQGTSFPTMKEYAKSLIRKFDRDSDGIITFQELCDGLSKMSLNVSIQEKQALMERLDLDRDGKITEKELYRVLQNADAPSRRLGGVGSIVEQTLKKIASGDDTNDMREYSKKLIRKFDKNSDGLISVQELTAGLKTMNIFLTQEERDALMSKLDLDRNGEISDHELYQALSTVSTADLASHAREAADIALKKLAAGSEEFSNMREYVNVLVRKLDYDNDGIITFTELCEGVKRLNIFLSLKEKQALMRMLDLDANGSLTADELYQVLSRVDTKLSKTELNVSIEHALRKIASGAEDFSSMREFVNAMFKNFDINFDGLISFEELVDGLRTININLTAQEQKALMKRFDFNRDGEISEDEFYRVLAPYEQRSIGAVGRSFSPVKSVSLGSTMKTIDYSQSYNSTAPVNVSSILEKIKRGASKYPSVDTFVAALMNRYDMDGDGLINQQELARGLENDGIRLTKAELLAVMNHIDVDRDGNISQDEIYNALSSDRGLQTSIGSSVDTLLKRIKLSADRFKSLEDFCRFVINKFDSDRSGSLSFNELSAGLQELSIHATVTEKMDLMRILDTDGDGEVGFMELYNGLSGFSGSVNLDNIMAKITLGADQYRSVEEYVNTLFRRFDINRDGAVSYQELRDGLRSMKVTVNDNETKALFSRLDADHDGSVTNSELYDAIVAYSGNAVGGSSIPSNQLNNILMRIAQGAEKARTIEDFVIAIFRRFDMNQDGAISFTELRDGLLSMNVRLEDSEVRALFTRLDVDRDGSVTNYELYAAIFTALESSPKYNSHKFTSTDTVMWMIKKAGEKYPILREYVDFLMRKFDFDNDGLIGFEELGKGLKSIEVKATDQEHLAIMRILDKDRDGGISKFELFGALEAEFGNTKTQANASSSFAVDNIITQLKKRIDPYKSQGEQILNMMKIFDKDQDGLISYNELVEGLRVLGIKSTRGDAMDLMNKIDLDKDGIVTQMELSKALGLYGGTGSQSPNRYKSLYK